MGMWHRADKPQADRPGKRQRSRRAGRDRATTAILVAIVLFGFALIAYPTVSDWVNSYTQSVAAAAYQEAVAQADPAELQDMWDEATQYNQELAAADSPRAFAERNAARYQCQLDVSGSGVMGTVEIPKINVSLPLYHYATDEVLAHAIGHLEWSSLPTGGEGTHTVVSGHRGLPSAVLFTNLDQLQEGDTFSLNVLGRALTYQVDSILIVEPNQVETLGIQAGKDLCTLVTCTPYGINTHRLLITGHRVEEAEDTSSVILAEASRVDPRVVALVMTVVVLTGLLVVALVRTSRPRAKTQETTDESEES